MILGSIVLDLARGAQDLQETISTSSVMSGADGRPNTQILRQMVSSTPDDGIE